MQLLLSLHLQLPQKRHWHGQDYDVSKNVEDGENCARERDGQAIASDVLVPDVSQREALKDRRKGQDTAVAKHEQTDSPQPPREVSTDEEYTMIQK